LVNKKAPGGILPALLKVASGAVARFIMLMSFFRFVMPTAEVLLKPA
jgi:hypothetical protein